jgi:MFS transporter, FHS family, glucose/mannose:H+ symporter
MKDLTFNKLKLKVALIYNFALPALLLNCVGIFIFNLTKFNGVTTAAAGWLEIFKDFSILGGSIILASYIPKMGYKKSLLIGVVLEAIACLLMGLYPSFMTARLFFMFVGVAFALIKVSIYSTAGLITDKDTEHASFLSILEGFFMVGILSGAWIFAFFMSHGGWINTFWFLIVLVVVGGFLMLFVSIDESKLEKTVKKENFYDSYKKMLMLLAKITVWVFIALAICYLFIEQGILNFLPLFDQNILHLSNSASVEIISLLSAGIAAGRLIFGVVMKYIHWSKVLFVCILAALVTLIIALYLASSLGSASQLIGDWRNFPIATYMFPLVGFFVAPIYPTLCSSILTKQPIQNQSAMTVLIIVFSAIGGSLGSILVGEFFGKFGGLPAFGVFMVPLFILLILVFPYYLMLKNQPGG